MISGWIAWSIMQKLEYQPGFGQAFGLATQRAQANIVPNE
jgi:hypothetical protein